ncbi:FecCD family ABC transporter permease [Polycladidibacter stylochi]|uniref:FecCD family ABC transporter permease n=1 Tax=Polycladidibacter stylochi TaxID=1807766 RepID=UPI00082A6384|nr:iron chelate uptake ABC transporter family permease subunit [Pseudovibrio stylochi]
MQSKLAVCVLICVLGGAIVTSIAIGPGQVNILQALDIILNATKQKIGLLAPSESAAISTAHIIIMEIRLPRILLAGVVGSMLAVAGAMMQGLFRNPLADPGLIGVSSGSAMFAVLAIVLGPMLTAHWPADLQILVLPLSAFVGGLATTFLLYKIATRQGQTSIATMLLAGIALAALTSAVTGTMLFYSTDEQMRDITYWTMGSLSGATWLKLAIVTPVLLVMVLSLHKLAFGLNAFVLGEAEAYYLGVNTQRLKYSIMILVSVSVGVAVSVSGIIGFVGIVVPHVLRLAVGADHRTLLPFSALLGAIVLMSADTLARTLVAPAELPIGIITALIGAPVFLSILLNRRTLLDL